MSYQQEYQRWLRSGALSQAEKGRVGGHRPRAQEIEDRFFGLLEFGTAGLRGVMGVGLRRMNVHVIRHATQAFAQVILEEGPEAAAQGVAICYDCRVHSQEFAQAAAGVMAANGIPVRLFQAMRPTPELSFAVREYGCIAGLNVTASHNPPEYNGYKVYWEDGAQITAPRDREIIAEVNAITDFSQVRTMGLREAEEAGLFQHLGEEMDSRYIEELKKLVLNPEVVREQGKDMRIVYTPLHGTGNLPVRRILKELGFEKVWVVPEQELPDGDFPTVSYPNPEDKNAFALALKLAKEVDADIVLATDPDATAWESMEKTNKQENICHLLATCQGC